MTNYLNFGETRLPVRFGFAALYQYEKETGRSAIDDFAEIAKSFKVTVVVDLLYCGLLAGHSFENKEFSMSKDEVANYLDSDMVAQVTKMFEESFDKTVDEGDGKKKVSARAK